MAKKQVKRRKTTESPPKKEDTSKKTWADVGYRIVDALYDLTQSGNLFGVVILTSALVFIIQSARMPPESIPGIWTDFLRFFSSEFYYIVPLSLVAVASIIINIIQYKFYTAHINDLAEHRRILVHGKETGELEELQIHTTSGFDVKKGSKKEGE